MIEYKFDEEYCDIQSEGNCPNNGMNSFKYIIIAYEPAAGSPLTIPHSEQCPKFTWNEEQYIQEDINRIVQKLQLASSCQTKTTSQSTHNNDKTKNHQQ